MKNLLLTTLTFIIASITFGQNINDHRVSFNYIQLPLIKIDDKFTNYELRIEHAYQTANEDSTNLHQMKQETAIKFYEQQLAIYQLQRDSLDRTHLLNMANWEKKVNSGITNPDGSAINQPAPPVYPEPPAYPKSDEPLLHTEMDESVVKQSVAIEGYNQGLGGFVVHLTIHPIQHRMIQQTKKGTGAETKYMYNAPYILPITVKVESPTQGVLYEEKLLQGVRNYKMSDQKSQYDHQLYMLDHKREFYLKLEEFARKESINTVSSLLNNQFGYVTKTHSAELYSVKKYKDYDYSDVTNAFTLATQALQLVSNDRDRSGAMDKIEEALEAIEGVLEESNTYDKKARINTKVTAMLQCNQVELLVWAAEYDKANGILNIAMNSGEGKAKRHLKDVQGFYSDQRKRWDANY